MLVKRVLTNKRALAAAADGILDETRADRPPAARRGEPHRRRALDAGRAGPRGRGRGAPQRGRTHLRPRGRRRGPGPVGHGAASDRPSLPVAVDDGARRPRAGHGARPPRRAGRTPSSTSARPPPHRSRSSSSAIACLVRSSTSPTGSSRRSPPASARRGPYALTGSRPRSSPRRPASSRVGWRASPLTSPRAGAPSGSIVPATLTDEVADALGTAGVTFGTGARGGLGDVVTLLAPPEAKGLEFDAVIVVEPSAVYDDERGGRLLYIALDACGAGARHRPRRAAPGRAAGLTGVAEVGGEYHRRSPPPPGWAPHRAPSPPPLRVHHRRRRCRLGRQSASRWCRPSRSSASAGTLGRGA